MFKHPVGFWIQVDRVAVLELWSAQEPAVCCWYNKRNIDQNCKEWTTLSFIASILYYDQQMHNYFKNCYTPTCYDSIVSSSGSV